MKREIAVEGKPYRVEVTECDVGKPLRVKLNDEFIDVTLEKEPSTKDSFTVKVRGKPYLVELAKIERSKPFEIKVNDVPLKIELKLTPTLVVPISTATMLIQSTSKKRLEEGSVAAPMAGKIIAVKVKKGDSVKVGSLLCTLEAMKMENEITAPRAGIVEEVLAKEGSSVNEGEVLVRIR